MKKYKAEYDKIKQVTVIKETEYFVTVQYDSHVRREAKTSEYSSYFDTWQEAKDCIVKRAEENLKYARLRLQEAQGKYGNAIGLKE